MPASQKTTSRPRRTATARSTAAARARAEEDAHRLDHISEMLDAAQKDLSSIGGSVGTGVRDLRRDVSRMLRDARRDLGKMRRAVQRDLERLQKDLASAGKHDGAPTTRTARRQAGADSH